MDAKELRKLSLDQLRHMYKQKWGEMYDLKHNRLPVSQQELTSREVLAAKFPVGKNWMWYWVPQKYPNMSTRKDNDERMVILKKLVTEYNTRIQNLNEKIQELWDEIERRKTSNQSPRRSQRLARRLKPY